MYKELLAAAAIVLTFAMFLPYIRSIRAGRTKPHAFSWIVWALATLVVFFAQLADRGGSGAWPIGLSGVITGYIAVLAYRERSDTSITKVDWVFLTIALAALPCWFLTSNPLVAVVLLTAMDLAGFVPTFRFAFFHPHEEHVGFYSLGALRNALAIGALEHYSLTTVLFPAAVGIACVLFVALVGYRRAQLRARRERTEPESAPGS
jgi:RsiW-degrading membrane proteinase PrsW (M82 family)